ncbi:hypothetical protein ACLMJK_002899 [Lecanora helva]
MSNQMLIKAVLTCCLVLEIACQISLDSIPSDACIGHPVATATTESTTSVLTNETVQITPGPAWNQDGASWEWILGSKDFIWSYVGIPGAGAGFGDGGIPESVNDAFKMSPDNKTISFSVPSQNDDYTVVAEISAAPNNAKFVRSARPTLATLANDGKVAVTLSGASPCAGPTMTSSIGPTDAAIASSCSNNKITPGPAAFTTYKVSSYMSSLLVTALPPHGVAGPYTLDAGSVIKSDVGAPGPKCTYTAQCDNIDCGDVKDYNDGTVLSVQRFIAYQAVVNFNNYLHSLYEALHDAAAVTGLMSADIVNTFFVNPKPDATWQQVIGVAAPIVGFMSAALGPVLAAASTAAGIASGLTGTAGGAGVIAGLSPVADKRFDEFASISAYIGQFLQSTSSLVENAYNVNIGPETSSLDWTGSELIKSTGLFGDGTFSDSDFAQSLTTNAQNSMAKVFSYKSINFALKDSGNFIMYVPYGVPVMGTNGKTIKEGINEQYCHDNLKNTDEMGTITICDASGGMARIFNAGKGQGSATDASELLKSRPQGWDSNLQVGEGETFNMGSAVKGSVASWRAGDFNYDVGDPFNNSFSNGTELDVDALQKVQISQETAGFFSIPVCQVLDLRAYPPASGYGCTRCDSAAAVGGTKGSDKKFWDNISQDMQTLINSGPNGDTCVQIICAPLDICDFDTFTG